MFEAMFVRHSHNFTPILTALTLSLLVQASPWYPLGTGRTWVYLDVHRAILIAATTQPPETFAGATVIPLQWAPGPREFLSQDENGRVFEHGVAYPDGGYLVFDPPMLRMENTLMLGQQWETLTTAILHAPDGAEIQRGFARSAFEVIAIGPVTVAGETFDAAEVLRTEESNLQPGAAHAPESTKSRFSTTFRDSYAEGVGYILRTDANGVSPSFILHSYQGGVPTELASWGEVKSLFGQ